MSVGSEGKRFDPQPLRDPCGFRAAIAEAVIEGRNFYEERQRGAGQTVEADGDDGALGEALEAPPA